MTAQEAIQKARADLALAARQSDMDYPDDDMNLSSILPVAELKRCGFDLEMVGEGDADTLPRSVVRGENRRLEIERCPFAPLVLLSGDDGWDGAEVVDVLQKAGMTALKTSDFDSVPDWHGVPLIDWLFPERLSEALSLFDALRAAAES